MYNSASVTFNFGPDFKYPPMDVGTFMPCTRLVQVFDELQEKCKAEAEAAVAIAAAKAAEEAALAEAAAAQRKADEMNSQADGSTPYASSAGLSTSSAAISLLLNPVDDEPMDVDPFFKPPFDVRLRTPRYSRKLNSCTALFSHAQSGENRDRG